MNRWKYVLVGLLVGAFAFPLVWNSDPLVIGQTVTVDSTQSPLVVNALADLADLTPTDGQSVIIKTGTEKGLWYYDKDSAAVVDSVAVLTGPGSVGRFLVINNDAGSIAAATAITAAQIDNDVDIEFGVFDADSARSLTLAELKKTGVQVVNVMQHGATGDGVADDTAEIQLAIDAVDDAGGGVVYLPAGSYKLSGNLTLYSNVSLYGPDATLTRSSGTSYIAIAGSSGSSSNLYANALKGATTFKAATKAVFDVGDWVCIMNSPNADEDSSKGESQELTQVVSVDDSDPSFDVVEVKHGLGFQYSVTGMATAAKAYVVTPIENVDIDLAGMTNVTIYPKLVNGLRANVRATPDTQFLLQQAAPSASSDGDFSIRSVHTIAPGGGPNSHAQFYGWRNLNIDAACVGGYEDGIRIRSSTGVNCRAVVDSYGTRAFNVYKTSGVVTPVVTNGPTIATGNVENVLIDFSEDLQVNNMIVSGFSAGDGCELRGPCRNIEINKPHIEPLNGATTQSSINVHGSDRYSSHITVRGGTIVGFNRGISLPDQCNRVLIDGVKIVPTASTASMTGIGVNDSSFGQFTDVTIANCYIRSKNAPSIGLYGTASASPMKNVFVINNTLGPPGSNSSSLTATYVNGLNIIGTKYSGRWQTQVFTMDNVTGGTFTMTYLGQTTSALAYNIAAADLQAALNGLSTIQDDPVTVTGSAGGPYTITFANGIEDYDPQPFTFSIASLTGTYKLAHIAPTSYLSKVIGLENCTNVTMRGNDRPSANFKATLTSVGFVESSDIWITDSSPHFPIAKKPNIYDSFTDADTTAIASHAPDIGGITWLETSGPDATILSNRLKITTNNNVVYTDINTSNFVAEFGMLVFSDAAHEYSFVVDYDDANNHTAVKFSGGTTTISIVETVASTPTTLATYSGWFNRGVEHRFKVEMAGKYLAVSAGNEEILRATLTSLGTSGVIGFRKDPGNSTGESAFSSIAISY